MAPTQGNVKAYVLNDHYTDTKTDTKTNTATDTTVGTSSGTISGTITGTITASQWGTRPPPIAAVYVKERNYVFYFTSTSKISYLRGKDGHADFSDTTLLVKDGQKEVTVEVVASKALLAATVFQDKNGTPVSIRVYYTTGTSNELKELIGEFESGTTDTINWRSGGFTNKKYKASPASGLTASSSPSGKSPSDTVLRVFFMSEEKPAHISEAYYVEGADWKLKTLE